MKSIVLLGGGIEQVDAIKISKELGYNTIVLDSNLLAVGRKFSDKFIQCDIKNSSEVFFFSPVSPRFADFIVSQEDIKKISMNV